VDDQGLVKRLNLPTARTAPTELGYDDLVWHECEFREGGSFTYAVHDAAGQYLGCCYLYPMGRRLRSPRNCSATTLT
jgi:hypothetical protein